MKHLTPITLLLCTVLLISQTGAEPSVQPLSFSPESGRYQLVVGDITVLRTTADGVDSTDSHGALFKIDTQTGDVWRYLPYYDAKVDKSNWASLPKSRAH